jgi:hypothetical protein
MMFFVGFFLVSIIAVLLACVISISLALLIRGDVVDVVEAIRSSWFDALRGGIFVTGAVCIVVLVNYLD